MRWTFLAAVILNSGTSQWLYVTLFMGHNCLTLSWWQAQQAFSGDGGTVNVTRVMDVLNDLQIATAVDNETAPELPQSLETTNSILDMALTFLMDDLESEDPIALNTVSSHKLLESWLQIVAYCPLASGGDYQQCVGHQQ